MTERGVWLLIERNNATGVSPFLRFTSAGRSRRLLPENRGSVSIYTSKQRRLFLFSFYAPIGDPLSCLFYLSWLPHLLPPSPLEIPLIFLSVRFLSRWVRASIPSFMSRSLVNKKIKAAYLLASQFHGGLM